MIDYQDLKIEVWPVEGHHARGGQHTNGPAPPGVRVTHVPTGLTAFCEIARSSHVNREIAIEMILTALTHPKFK